jgi:hypothetical protein
MIKIMILGLQPGLDALRVTVSVVVIVAAIVIGGLKLKVR